MTDASSPGPSAHGPAPGAGISTALEATVARFRRMILAVGLGHGLSEADVDEVMQEVRIRLWRSRGSVEALEGLGASYVHRAARSAAIDVIRKRRALRTGPDATEPLAPTLALAEEDPQAELEHRALGRRVFQAVDQLIDSRRPVVRMHLLGYDRREIARLLGASEGEVRNLLSRGMADLRGLLDEQGIGPGGER